MKRTRNKAGVIPYLFILPSFVFVFTFGYFTSGEAIWMSFTNFNTRLGNAATRFVGVANYVGAFQDAYFWKSFGVQAIITVYSLIVGTVMPLLAAELLYFVRRKKIAGVFRMAFVVPMLVPVIVVLMTWRYLYNPSFGFNSILKAVGMASAQQDWLNNAHTALAAVLLVGFPYVSGLAFLVFYGGLANIGAEMQDAATVDGASSLQSVFYIHIPNLVPYISVIGSLTIIASLTGSMGSVLAMTGGGPGSATMIPALYMYKMGFGNGMMGYACAFGVIIFVVVLALTLGQRRLFGTKLGG